MAKGLRPRWIPLSKAAIGRLPSRMPVIIRSHESSAGKYEGRFEKEDGESCGALESLENLMILLNFIRQAAGFRCTHSAFLLAEKAALAELVI